jgi:O-antigen/teichoic acid export membrane protein
MSSSSQTVAKNVTVLMASQLVTWGLALLLTILLPRYLGPTVFGQLAIALAVWTIAGVLVSFGMDVHLTKEIARNPDRVSELLITSILLRFLLFGLSSVLVAGFAFLNGYSTPVLILLIIVGTSALFNTMDMAFQATLRGLEVMEYISIANIINKSVYCFGSILLMVLGFNIYPIAATLGLGMLTGVVIQFFALRRIHPIRFTKIDIAAVRPLLVHSIPYFMSMLTLALYNQIDTLIIAAIATEQVVGWYDTAARLYATLMFVPVAFSYALFPLLSRSYVNDPDVLIRTTGKSFNLMFLAAVPMGFGIMLISDTLVPLLFGEAFQPASAVLMLMGVVLIFTYLNTLLGQIFVSTDRTNTWTAVMMVAAIATVPLDLLLVPWTQQVFSNGAIGGALSYMTTEFGIVVAAILMLPRATLNWSNVRTAGLSLVSGLLMIAATWPLRQYPLPVPILVGAVSYVGMMYLLRVVPPDEMQILRGMIGKMLAQVRGKLKRPAGV